MALVLQCPYFITDGFSKWCMNGKFPCNCDLCDCKEKHYIEICTSTNAITIKNP